MRCTMAKMGCYDLAEQVFLRTAAEILRCSAQFALAGLCIATYLPAREAALPLLPFLGVSSLMNWPGLRARPFFLVSGQAFPALGQLFRQTGDRLFQDNQTLGRLPGRLIPIERAINLDLQGMDPA